MLRPVQQDIRNGHVARWYPASTVLISTVTFPRPPIEQYNPDKYVKLRFVVNFHGHLLGVAHLQLLQSTFRDLQAHMTEDFRTMCEDALGARTFQWDNAFIPLVDYDGTPYELLDSQTIEEVLYDDNVKYLKILGVSYRTIRGAPDIGIVFVDHELFTGTTIMPSIRNTEALARVEKFSWWVGEFTADRRLPPLHRGADGQLVLGQWRKIHEGVFLDLTEQHVTKNLAVVADLGLESVATAYSPLGSIVKPSYNANDLIFTKRQQHCSTGPPDGCYRILSYNVLADKYTKSEEPEHPFFPYCDSAALSVNTRYPLLLKELKGYLADLLFLQEVDQSIYVTYLKNYLEALGYDSIYAGKGVNGKALEGCVTAYKRAKFEYMKHDRALLSQFALNGNNGDIIQLLEQNEADRTLFLSRTNVNLVVVLRERSTKGILVTANTHIYFKPENANIKVLQAVLCCRHLNDIYQRLLTGEIRKIEKKEKPRIIFAGDFNSTPNSAVFRYLEKGAVDDDDPCWKEGPAGNFSVPHERPFLSLCGSPDYTNVTKYWDEKGQREAGFTGCLDYIWGDPEIQVERIIPMPEENLVTRHTALPSILAPSDHIALVCDVRFPSRSIP